LVREAIADFRSHIEDCDEEPFRLIDLAAACMAEAVWSLDEQLSAEEVFNTCRRRACFDLKSRAGHLQRNASAIEAGIPALL
jgi:hypothetical protein